MKTEFEIRKTKHAGAALLVKGDLTVRCSIEFKERLTELAMATTRGVPEISLKDVTVIDVSAIQLLHAAKQEFFKGGYKMSVVWPDNEVLNTLITKTGIKQAL